MDPNVLHLIVAAVSTLAFAVVTALIWKRGQVKTVFWWIGLTLLPFGLYLLGLAPALQGAVETLTAWATGLTFTRSSGPASCSPGCRPSSCSAAVSSPRSRSPIAAPRARRRPSSRRRRPDASSRPPLRRATAAPSRRAGRHSRTPQASLKPAQASGSSQDAEFDEIADILRKRGIN